MKNFKKLSALLLISSALAIASSANAATASGTVTITGTASTACTLVTPPVNVGVIQANRAAPVDIPVTIGIDCASAWSLAPTANSAALTIGATTTNLITFFRADGTTAFSNLAPQTGAGSGSTTNVSIVMRAWNSAFNLGPVGTGAISASPGFTLTY